MSNKLSLIIAALALVGSFLGWLISIEVKVDSKLDATVYYQQQKELRHNTNAHIHRLEHELNTDIRDLRLRINHSKPSYQNHYHQQPTDYHVAFDPKCHETFI